MTQTPQEIRILLGPVARGLIEGVDRNRPSALDVAITTLKNQVRDLSEQASPVAPDQPTSDERILSVLKTQSRAIREMSELAVAEMKMTRLLISALLKDSDNDDPRLRELSETVIDQIYENSSILSADDRDGLLQKEEAFLTATRLELERGPDACKTNEGREIER
ncbi:hypothetical protein [Pukyongiella litopenaei]|uniref:Uncharacterized protein n=1 Tax=Pukyongiella litopenaei TaxID=2605946 RepID=A0A5C2H3E3_9RHOB|nr:hypothetical protein [Pukyongiella litopenaei]QEP30416.1 hypothetical protein C6Y53_19560 [Pukyongiella litopenaei]